MGTDIDGAEANDRSGSSLSLSADGTTAAMGAEYHDRDKGHVRIFRNVNGTWTQIRTDIDGAEFGDASGISVSLNADGSIVAIGSLFHDGRRGHVRAFQLPQQANDFESVAIAGFNQDLIVKVQAVMLRQ